MDVLSIGGCSRLLDPSFDSLGHERIKRGAGWHHFWDAMGHDEQGQPGHRASPSPSVGYVIGAAPCDDRAASADTLVEELRARPRHLVRRVDPAGCVTSCKPAVEYGSCVAVRTRDEPIEGSGKCRSDHAHPLPRIVVRAIW